MDTVPGLLDIPSFLLLKLMDHLAAVETPGAVVRLGKVCRGLHAVVASHGSLWEKQCNIVGWRCHDRPGSSGRRHTDAPPYGSASRSRSMERRVRQSTPCAALDPFSYYCRRMEVRWRVRSLMRKYATFMTFASQRSIASGASLRDLATAEERLGVELPWEVWESFRFRDGQLHTPGAEFVDAARLLSLSEVVEELLPVVTRHRVEGGCVFPRELRSSQPCGARPDSCEDPAAYIGGGGAGNELLLPLTTWMRGNKRVTCGAASGHIYFVSGFMVIKKAECWTAFLQSLLR